MSNATVTKKKTFNSLDSAVSSSKCNG
jgi:hypothetical protein